jgi:hypothetical protein
MKNIRNIFSAQYFTFRSSKMTNKQKKGKEINIFKSLARSNGVATKFAKLVFIEKNPLCSVTPRRNKT